MTNGNHPKVNPHAGVGPGRFRQPYKIKEHLDLLGIPQVEVARRAGVHRTFASRTIRGLENNKAILRQLYKLGCSIEILSPPPELVKEFEALGQEQS